MVPPPSDSLPGTARAAARGNSLSRHWRPGNAWRPAQMHLSILSLRHSGSVRAFQGQRPGPGRPGSESPGPAEPATGRGVVTAGRRTTQLNNDHHEITGTVLSSVPVMVIGPGT